MYVQKGNDRVTKYSYSSMLHTENVARGGQCCIQKMWLGGSMLHTENVARGGQCCIQKMWLGGVNATYRKCG